MNDAQLLLRKLPPGEYLKDEDVAALFGVDERTVVSWRKHRGLPHCKLTTKVVRMKRADIEAWADAKRVTLTVPA
jgi:hypothetical protein